MMFGVYIERRLNDRFIADKLFATTHECIRHLPAWIAIMNPPTQPQRDVRDEVHVVGDAPAVERRRA